ncbi:MAG: FecR domain-containing protein [Gammaproteobacteria bacterium]
MPAIPTPPAPDKRRQEATKWLARLERGLGGNEGRDLREWLKDKKNSEVILDAASLWHSSDVHAVLCTLLGTSQLQRTRPTPPRRTLTLPLVVALGSTVALLVILWSGHMPWASAHGSQTAQTEAPSAVYSTAVGETRQVTLRDGTLVTLNTGTRISVSFLPRGREVYLASGEATFKVAPGGDGPLSVTAGRRRFEARDTRFNLRTLTRENVELTVIEGHVTVIDAPARLPDSAARRRDAITYGEQIVNAFEEAIVEPGFQSVSPIQASEVQARLAWQQGLIVFDDKALSDALAEVERYTQARFVLADAKLGALRMSGRFHNGNVNAVRLALRQNLLLASRRDTRGRIVLSPVHSS